MNFTYLVESGKYKKSDLSDCSQAFISGMEEDMEIAENFLENECEFPEEDSDTISNIKREIAESVIDGFEAYLKSSINENIVILADREAN